VASRCAGGGTEKLILTALIYLLPHAGRITSLWPALHHHQGFTARIDHERTFAGVRPFDPQPSCSPFDEKRAASDAAPPACRARELFDSQTPDEDGYVLEL
jgi:hypothetical protein